MPHPLEVLGISSGASLDDAKAAFRALSLKYHPDKNPNDPIAPERFQEVLDAYESVMQHPELLNTLSTRNYNLFSYSEPISISLEAVYLHEKQSITIERSVICPLCKGTGSDTGACGTCDGTGKIKGTIARLMDIDPICPACHGVGYVGPACTRCNGNKFVKQRNTIWFYVEPKNCINGAVLLKGVGDMTYSGIHKDIWVPIHIIDNGRVSLDKSERFNVVEIVSPIEQILSVVKTIKIYGRELRYRVPQSASFEVIRDLVGKIEREIRIDIHVLPRPLTEKTKKLYKEILELESKQ